MSFRFALLASCTCVLALPAAAQTRGEPEAATKMLNRVTVVDCDAEEIDGALDGPALERIPADSRLAHNSLIRVRVDFKAKALASVAEMPAR